MASTFISLTMAGKTGFVRPPPTSGTDEIDECRILKGNRLGGSWSGICVPSLALLTSCSAFIAKKYARSRIVELTKTKSYLRLKIHLDPIDRLDLNHLAPISKHKRMH